MPFAKRSSGTSYRFPAASGFDYRVSGLPPSLGASLAASNLAPLDTQTRSAFTSGHFTRTERRGRTFFGTTLDTRRRAYRLLKSAAQSKRLAKSY